MRTRRLQTYAMALSLVAIWALFAIATDGVFLAIGHIPNTGFLEEQVALDEHGYIVPGLGDAGDRIFGTK